MTGLRQYKRDLRLPSALSDAALCLPDSDELAGLVNAHLLIAGAPRVESVSIEHARWKPGISCVGTWRITLEDGSKRIVVMRRYAGADGRVKAQKHRTVGRHYHDPHMRASEFIDSENSLLWTFPADRSLDGAARVMDVPRTARLLESLSVVEPWRIKASLSTCELLRYKPERRVVAKFTAKLHRPAPKPRHQSVILRVLSTREASHSARARESLQAADSGNLVPRLLGHELLTGIIVEEFVPGLPWGHSDFSSPAQAGGLIARLHSLPAGIVESRAQSPSDVAALLAVDARLARYEVLPPPPAPRDACWIHGDFHPDQVMHTENGGLCLLDLDGLSIGDPLEDLASWVADVMAADSACGFDQAHSELLGGYHEAGGRTLSVPALMRHTAFALQARATASLRRLQVGGVEKARACMQQAVVLMKQSEGRA